MPSDCSSLYDSSLYGKVTNVDAHLEKTIMEKPFYFIILPTVLHFSPQKNALTARARTKNCESYANDNNVLIILYFN